MAKVRVFVTYKESILDPQGEAVKKAVNKLGYSGITDIRISKVFEMEGSGSDLTGQAAEIADQLLANPNMETYRVEGLES